MGYGAQSGDIKRLKLPHMPRSKLVGRHLKSPDDVKAATVQLRHALEAVGVTVAPSKVSEVIALLCGAASYDELQKTLKGIPQPDRSERRAQTARGRKLLNPSHLFLLNPVVWIMRCDATNLAADAATRLRVRRRGVNATGGSMNEWTIGAAPSRVVLRSRGDDPPRHRRPEGWHARR